MSEVGERFWSKVDRSAGPYACWLWTGTRRRRGSTLWHGQFRVGRKIKTAHRVAYESVYTCDNPGCVNPLHLIPGTHADNARDRSNRRRTGFGCGGLTDSEVEGIRRAGASGSFTHKQIARTYGCDRSTVSLILKGRRRAAAGDTVERERAERFSEAA